MLAWMMHDNICVSLQVVMQTRLVCWQVKAVYLYSLINTGQVRRLSVFNLVHYLFNFIGLYVCQQL